MPLYNKSILLIALIILFSLFCGKGAFGKATIESVALDNGTPVAANTVIYNYTNARYRVIVLSDSSSKPVGFPAHVVVSSPCSFILGATSTSVSGDCFEPTGTSGAWTADCYVQVTWSVANGGTLGQDFCAAQVSVADSGLIFVSSASDSKFVGTILSGNVTINENDSSASLTSPETNRTILAVLDLKGVNLPRTTSEFTSNSAEVRVGLANDLSLFQPANCPSTSFATSTGSVNCSVITAGTHSRCSLRFSPEQNVEGCVLRLLSFQRLPQNIYQRICSLGTIIPRHAKFVSNSSSVALVKADGRDWVANLKFLANSSWALLNLNAYRENSAYPCPTLSSINVTGLAGRFNISVNWGVPENYSLYDMDGCAINVSISIPGSLPPQAPLKLGTMLGSLPSFGSSSATIFISQRTNFTINSRCNGSVCSILPRSAAELTFLNISAKSTATRRASCSFSQSVSGSQCEYDEQKGSFISCFNVDMSGAEPGCEMQAAAGRRVGSETYQTEATTFGTAQVPENPPEAPIPSPIEASEPMAFAHPSGAEPPTAQPVLPPMESPIPHESPAEVPNHAGEPSEMPTSGPLHGIAPQIEQPANSPPFTDVPAPLERSAPATEPNVASNLGPSNPPSAETNPVKEPLAAPSDQPTAALRPPFLGVILNQEPNSFFSPDEQQSGPSLQSQIPFEGSSAPAAAIAASITILILIVMVSVAGVLIWRRRMQMQKSQSSAAILPAGPVKMTTLPQSESSEDASASSTSESEQDQPPSPVPVLPIKAAREKRKMTRYESQYTVNQEGDSDWYMERARENIMDISGTDSDSEPTH